MGATKLTTANKVEITELADASEDRDVIEDLVEIEHEAFGDGGLNEWGLVPLIYHGAVYVLFLNDEPIGVIEYMRDMEDLDTAYVYGLVIAKGYRDQGYGSQLFDYSLEDIKNKGIKDLELTVDPDNARAIHVYKKFGFEQTDYREGEYGRDEDRVIMELSL